MKDENGEDISIEKSWSATSMAHAFKDPYWRAKVKAEGNRAPHLKEVIESTCSRCHAPMANVEANHLSEGATIFDGGFADTSNPHYKEAMEGVSCTLCHQVENTPELGTLDGFSGHFQIGTERIIYGPFSDVEPEPMRRKNNYEITYSEHMESSKMCATCHNLKTPFLDEHGQIIPQSTEDYFPEEMPFTEWQYSSVSDSKSCQDCHMKKTNGAPIASKPRWAIKERDGFARHIFAGGNKLLLDILDTNRKALGVTASKESFEFTMAETDKKLKHASSIEVVEQTLGSSGLFFTLKINNNAGHKLSTAFLARRLILHVTIKDAEGNTVFESGRVNSDGSVTGADADADPTTYEPHYDLITSEDQVQMYEAVVRNNLGEVTYTILRSAGFLKDNRIPPKGFDKHIVPKDIWVVGGAFDDDNFQGGSDEISFRLQNLTGSEYKVNAELIYQAIAYPHVMDVASDSSAEAAEFKAMFDASQHKSTQMSTAEFTVVKASN
jgi:cytochrome c553